jgi:heat shock protein HslJ
MSRTSRAPRTLLPLAAILAAASLLAACGGGASPSLSPAPSDPPVASPSPDAAAAALEGARWVLVRGLAELPDGTTVDAVFEDGQIAGQGPCNRYFADATIDGSSLAIGPVGATKMSCGPALDAAEQAYVAALGTVASFTIADGTLTLLDANGGEVLVYNVGVSEAPTGLAGSRWSVLRYAGEDGALVATLPATEATVEFGADGRFGGTAGCNSFGSDYTVDEAAGTLTFGLFSTTMMMCEPPALMAQETGLVAALEKTAGFEITDGQLRLRDASGAVLVEAEAAPAS